MITSHRIYAFHALLGVTEFIDMCEIIMNVRDVLDLVEVVPELQSLIVILVMSCMGLMIC